MGKDKWRTTASHKSGFRGPFGNWRHTFHTEEKKVHNFDMCNACLELILRWAKKHASWNSLSGWSQVSTDQMSPKNWLEYRSEGDVSLLFERSPTKRYRTQTWIPWVLCCCDTKRTWELLTIPRCCLWRRLQCSWKLSSTKSAHMEGRCYGFKVLFTEFRVWCWITTNKRT